MANRLPTHRQHLGLHASLALSLALLLIFVAVLAGPALAQDYLFAVPRLQMQVFIEADGTARLVYDITFENQPSGRAIDIVDIGLPTAGYNISNMRAAIDGVELFDIRPSEYVKPGVEVHLAGRWISPGDTGTLHFEATVPDLLFQDVTNRDYASFQITPTWFDDQFISGLTDVQIAIHLPEGVSPEDMLYQNEAFGQRALFEDRAVALWDFPGERLTGPNLVGVSFPAAGIANVQRMTALDLAERWFVAQTTLRWVLGHSGRRHLQLHLPALHRRHRPHPVGHWPGWPDRSLHPLAAEPVGYLFAPVAGDLFCAASAQTQAGQGGLSAPHRPGGRRRHQARADRSRGGSAAGDAAEQGADADHLRPAEKRGAAPDQRGALPGCYRPGVSN
jgi:hypothetical protein